MKIENLTKQEHELLTKTLLSFREKLGIPEKMENSLNELSKQLFERLHETPEEEEGSSETLYEKFFNFVEKEWNGEYGDSSIGVYARGTFFKYESAGKQYEFNELETYLDSDTKLFWHSEETKWFSEELLSEIRFFDPEVSFKDYADNEDPSIPQRGGIIYYLSINLKHLAKDFEEEIFEEGYSAVEIRSRDYDPE